MSDYISREAAIEAIKASRMVYSGTWGKGLAMAAEKLRDLPAADVVEIKKPDHGYMWLCPHCGLPVHSDFEECLRCGTKRPSAHPELNEWCHDCKEYDTENDCCPRWGQVIRTALDDAKPEIIRCKDCRWWDKYGDYDKGYCMAAKHGYWSEHWDINIRRAYRGDFYCADAEPKGEQE